MDLAKRLNQELASQQQQTKQTGSLEATRPISPDGEPRSRSFEQRPKNSHKGKIPSNSLYYFSFFLQLKLFINFSNFVNVLFKLYLFLFYGLNIPLYIICMINILCFEKHFFS